MEENLIIGKWYKNSNWSSPKYFCKLVGFSSDSIIFYECIYNSKYRKDNTTSSWENSAIELATYEEYSKYLPDGHPDKIKDNSINTIYLIKFLEKLKIN